MDYKSLESKQDQLCIQIADYKNQLEYKDLVAQTAVISLGQYYRYYHLFYRDDLNDYDYYLVCYYHDLHYFYHLFYHDDIHCFNYYLSFYYVDLHFYFIRKTLLFKQN